MILPVILVIVAGVAYLAWDVFRVVRLNWRAAARLGESVSAAAERMASVEAPPRAAPPAESPTATLTRIAEVRKCGRAQRLTRTIERWADIYPG